MKHKLNMSPEDVYESIGKHVSYARKFTDDVILFVGGGLIFYRVDFDEGERIAKEFSN